MSFATIARTIWDADMRRLNPSEQHVLLYLHTCPSSASEGLFPIAPGLIALDTGLKVAEVLGTLQRLEEAGYLTYDIHAEMVLLRKSLEYQPLNKKGDKRISGAVSRVRGLKPNAQLMTDFYNIAQTTSPVLAEALRDELPHMFLEVAPNTQERLRGEAEFERRLHAQERNATEW